MPNALFPMVLIVSLGMTLPLQSQTVSSETFGFTKLGITAGTGTGKRSSLVSIPLLGASDLTGASHGRITGVGQVTLSSAGADWSPGELSRPEQPHLIEITSGAEEGRMLLISTDTPNTSDTVTIAQDELARGGPLDEMGIVAGLESGDTFRIRPVDTLLSFFGTPDETLIRGGSTPQTADTVTLVNNGSAASYFFSTASTPPQWVRVSLGSVPSNHVPILPWTGVQYSRISDTPLEFLVQGAVPAGVRKVELRDSGTTLLATYWQTDQTLPSLGLHNSGAWLSGASARNADTVVSSTGGSTTTYFFDGSNWRRVGLGNPLADNVILPTGGALLINKKGTSGSYFTYQHGAPYQLP